MPIEPVSPRPAADAPAAAARADAAGLSAFLDWVIDTGQPCRLTRNTLIGIRSTWRSLRLTLAVPDHTALSTLQVEDLVDRFAIAREHPLVSTAVYRTRLRRAFELYRRWLDGHPAWGDPTRPRARAPVRTTVVAYPLRPGLNVKVEIPEDFSAAEVDAIAAWLRTWARAGRGRPPQ